MNSQAPQTSVNSSQHGKSRHNDGTPQNHTPETISTSSATRDKQAQITTPLNEPARPHPRTAAGTPIAPERPGSLARKPANTPQWVKTPAGPETAVLDAWEQANIEAETVAEKPQPRPTLRPGSRECECTECGLFFGSPTGFDLHRTGYPDERRCLTPVEMSLRGMDQNARGFWVRPHHRPRITDQTAAQARGPHRAPPRPSGPHGVTRT